MTSCRRKGDGAVLRRGGAWRVRVQVDGKRYERVIHDPDTGERVRTKVHAQRVAGAVARTIQREVQQTVDPGDLMSLWRAYRQAFPTAYSTKNWKQYDRYIERFSEYFPTIAAITHEALGRYCRERLTMISQRGMFYSPSSINRELSMLRRVLIWAETVGHVDKNPLRGYRFLEEPSGRERILTINEIVRLETVLEDGDEDVRLIVLLALYTGMRKGEILGMRWEDLDPACRVIFLKRTKSKRGRYRLSRRVPVPEMLADALMQWRKRVGGEWVFPSGRGNGHRVDLRCAWRRICREAGIEGVRFHDLRHTAATNLARVADLGVVMEILGHQRAQTTKKYLNPDMNDRKQAVEDVVEWRKEKARDL